MAILRKHSKNEALGLSLGNYLFVATLLRPALHLSTLTTIITYFRLSGAGFRLINNHNNNLFKVAKSNSAKLTKYNYRECTPRL